MVSLNCRSCSTLRESELQLDTVPRVEMLNMECCSFVFAFFIIGFTLCNFPWRNEMRNGNEYPKFNDEIVRQTHILSHEKSKILYGNKEARYCIPCVVYLVYCVPVGIQ